VVRKVKLDKVDPAVASVRNDLISSSYLTQTYGLSFLVGGTQNILADFLGMPPTHQNSLYPHL
jgi:hypothetical protein